MDMDIELTVPKILKLNSDRYHILTKDEKRIFIKLVKMCSGNVTEATQILIDDLSITVEDVNAYHEENKMFKINHGNYNIDSKKVANKQKITDKTLLIEKIVDFIGNLSMVTDITVVNKNREILFDYRDTSYSLVLSKKNKK